jgi:hypothetical protein
MTYRRYSKHATGTNQTPKQFSSTRKCVSAYPQLSKKKKKASLVAKLHGELKLLPWNLWRQDEGCGQSLPSTMYGLHWVSGARIRHPMRFSSTNKSSTNIQLYGSENRTNSICSFAIAFGKFGIFSVATLHISVEFQRSFE